MCCARFSRCLNKQYIYDEGGRGADMTVGILALMRTNSERLVCTRIIKKNL